MPSWVAAPIVGSIPSPSSGELELGPISLHVYGVLLAVGIVVATLIAERQWQHKGHDRHEIQSIVFWVVVAGIVGARVYHVITDYYRFDDGRWVDAFKIWQGGLSIWGAVIGGALAVIVLTRRRHYDTLGIMDAMAPGILAAQAIGRWGNWFNQELFGEPTNLPWALEIDPPNRPEGFERDATFHPTFLYESIYCLVVLGALLWIERRRRLKRGQVFALYVAGYTFGRFWFENLRIDDAELIAGLRVNAWVSAALFLFGVGWFLWLGRHGTYDDAPTSGRAAGGDPATADPVA